MALKATFKIEIEENRLYFLHTTKGHVLKIFDLSHFKNIFPQFNFDKCKRAQIRFIEIKQNKNDYPQCRWYHTTKSLFIELENKKTMWLFVGDSLGGIVFSEMLLGPKYKMEIKDVSKLKNPS